MRRWRFKSPASRLFTQGADQRKHQTPVLTFVRGIHRWPANSPHKGPVTRKMSPFDDVIMIQLGHKFAPVTTAAQMTSHYMKQWRHRSLMHTSPALKNFIMDSGPWGNQQNVKPSPVNCQQRSERLCNWSSSRWWSHGWNMYPLDKIYGDSRWIKPKWYVSCLLKIAVEKVENK